MVIILVRDKWIQPPGSVGSREEAGHLLLDFPSRFFA